jgi:GNAT superfamily N-acetyltransferase
MNATLSIASPSGWLHRIAKGLGFLAPAAARAEPSADAVATAAIAKAAGRVAPLVILVDAFDARRAHLADLAAPIARRGFAVATVAPDTPEAERAEALDAALVQRMRAAAQDQDVAGVLVASPRALRLAVEALGDALPRVVMFDPRCGAPKCAGETRVAEAALHSRVLIVHDLADADAAEPEADALAKAWNGAELFMTHGLAAPIRATDGAFVAAIAEFLRRDRDTTQAVPAFPPSTRVLPSAESVRVRQLVPTDVARVQAFLDGLSLESRYNRFLAPRRLRPGEVARLSSPRPGTEFAVAAMVTVDGRESIAGVARYAATAEPDSVEVAVTIADAWQGNGLGRMLLADVVTQAQRQGYARATGVLLATNVGMQNLALRLGFSLRASDEDERLVEMERTLAAAFAEAPVAAEVAAP